MLQIRARLQQISRPLVYHPQIVVMEGVWQLRAAFFKVLCQETKFLAQRIKYKLIWGLLNLKFQLTAPNSKQNNFRLKKFKLMLSLNNNLIVSVLIIWMFKFLDLPIKVLLLNKIRTPIKILAFCKINRHLAINLV